MDSKNLFQNFNHSKFIVFACLLPAGILISLYLDGIIEWSLWLVLIPIWILKLIVILGAIIGTIVWFRQSYSRNEVDGYTEFKAMFITFALQTLLLLFELLLCNKLENNAQSSWILIFTPIYLVSPLSIGACVWSYRNARNMELEGLISLNILVLIFVSLKLEGIISWNWSVIFIPLWIIMTLPGIAILHLIWTFIFLRSSFRAAGRESNFSQIVMWTAVVVPLLTFQILLVCRLDKQNNLPWVNIFIPLHICFLALIWSSFARKEGNRWWFGIREDFCTFLLRSCPFMRLYGNVEYKSRGEVDNDSEEQMADDTRVVSASPSRYGVVVPITHISSPD